jgi:(p)ppGpp synthase/HD superfamily hydrolase
MLNSMIEVLKINMRYYNNYNEKEQEKIISALKLAYKKHESQKRKRNPNVPYITHPLMVTLSLMEKNSSSTLLIAGLLHDTVEDVNEDDNMQLREIKKLYGTEVSKIVSGVTNKSDFNDLDVKKPLDRKILLIKLHDRKHNLSRKENDGMVLKKIKKKVVETERCLIPVAIRAGYFEEVKILRELGKYWHPELYKTKSSSYLMKRGALIK